MKKKREEEEVKDENKNPKPKLPQFLSLCSLLKLLKGKGGSQAAMGVERELGFYDP